MKNKILITITTLHGSKQYTISELIKKFLISLFLLGFLFIISAMFIIGYMKKRIDENQQEIKNLTQTKNILLKNNIKLKKEIEEKGKKLSAINDKISDIEQILQITSPIELNQSERLNLAKMNLIDKKIMLQEIPNGYPIVYKGITSKFGWRKHPITHKKEFHPGIDLRAKMRTKVYAPADGMVNFAAYHKTSGYGRLLIINHNFGFMTLYGHLSGFNVKKGDFVKKGDLIAYTGNTGLSNGPHIHYEVRYLGMVLDPKPFLKWNLKNYNSIFRKEKKIRWQSLVKAIQWQKLIMQQQ